MSGAGRYAERGGFGTIDMIEQNDNFVQSGGEETDPHDEKASKAAFTVFVSNFNRAV